MPIIFRGKGFIVKMYPKEGGHNIPHVHVFYDGTHCGARKLSIDKYKYAKSFKNPDFLAAVSKRTTVKKDLRESLKTRSFVDKDIQYSEALQ